MDSEQNIVLPADGTRLCDKSMRELKTPHAIEYWFSFPGKEQAMAFSKNVAAGDFVTCVSYNEADKMWQAVVRKIMIPEYNSIDALDEELGRHAVLAGGIADGWGYKISGKNI